MEIFMKKRAKNRKMMLFLILAAIIFLQAFMTAGIGREKKEFHIDEIYSYLLSNSYDTDSFERADTMWNTWVSGSSFDEFVTVQRGEAFAFDKVYRNNSLDCHPPLFYWMLHTICSFFPDSFSKWYGLGLNLFTFLVTGVFLYLSSRRLIRNDAAAFLPLILYGFSQIAVDTALFIRMYGLLTCLAMIFIYLHIRMFQDGPELRLIVAGGIVTFLGAMTHYYFLLLGAAGAAGFCIYLLMTQRPKKCFVYAAAELLAVALFVAVYPWVIRQITNPASNNVSREMMRTLLDIALFRTMLKRLVTELCSVLFVKAAAGKIVLLISAAAGAALLILSLIRRKNRKEPVESPLPELLWISWTAAFVVLLVSYIGGDYVYLRYIYYICPMVYLLMAAAVCALGEKAGFGKITAAVLISATLVNAVLWTGNVRAGNLRCSYLYGPEAAVTEDLASYSTLNCFVVSRRGSAVPTGNLTRLRNFNQVYMADFQSLERSGEFSRELKENRNCMLYINTDTYWTDGYDPQSVIASLQKENPAADFLKCQDSSLGMYYLVMSRE